MEFLRDERVRYFIRSDGVLAMFRAPRLSPATLKRLRFYRELEAQ